MVESNARMPKTQVTIYSSTININMSRTTTSFKMPRRNKRIHIKSQTYHPLGRIHIARNISAVSPIPGFPYA